MFHRNRFFNRFINWFYEVIFDRVVWFFSWIKKSCEYAWFLRKDHDWDYLYILELLRYKLDRTAKAIYHSWTVESAPQTKKEINEICHMLDILTGKIDIESHYDLHVKKWGHPTIEVNKNGCLYYKVPTAQTEEEIKKERKEFHIAIQLDEAEYEALGYKVFNTIAKKYRGWWD